MYPKLAITVSNRGVNGEESRDMVARFDRDVFAQHPDLVLWQVGVAGDRSFARFSTGAAYRQVLVDVGDIVRQHSIAAVLRCPELYRHLDRREAR